MNTTAGAVIVIAALVAFFVIVVAWLVWTSRESRSGRTDAERYHRISAGLHSPRSRRGRSTWAAGGYSGGYIGSDGGYDGGSGCGGGGCGGGGD